MISVSKTIEGFDYRPRSKGGSFKSWLLNLTRWRIQDQFRKRPKDSPLTQRSGDDSDPSDPLDKIPDPKTDRLEEIWKTEWERNLMDVALKQLKRQVDGKHFQVFHLNVVKNWPPKKVAGALSVNIGQVYLVKHRLARKLEELIQELRKDE